MILYVEDCVLRFSVNKWIGSFLYNWNKNLATLHDPDYGLLLF